MPRLLAPHRLLLTRICSVLAILLLFGQILMFAVPHGIIEAGLGAGFVLLVVMSALNGVTVALISAPIMAALVVVVFIGAESAEIALSTLRQGSSQAVAFVALFVALAMMRVPAQRSRVVQEAGATLVSQPAGRRSIALTLGSHVIGIVMHIGTLAMVGTMIRRGAGNGLPRTRLIASQAYRLCVLAPLRGFSTTTCWAPTSVTAAYLATTVPGADYGRVLPVGIGFAAYAIVLGFIVDTFTKAEGVDPIKTRAELDFGTIIRLLFVIAGIVACVLGTQVLTGIRMIEAVTVAIPIVCMTWILCQEFGRQRPAQRLNVRLRSVMWHALPATLPETVLLGAIGFISVAISTAQPSDYLAAITGSLPSPAVLVPIITVLMLIALSKIGLPPFVALVILIALWGDTSRMDIPVEVMLLAYLAGWSMAVQTSISAANLLILARATEVPMKAIIRWNRPFFLAVVAGLVIFFVARPLFIG